MSNNNIILYELTGSPNNVKIRLALDVKGLEYDRIPIDFDEYPGDRTLPVGVSGQPLLPVLKHGKTVIYDSRGILRYLDANFPDTHSLFSSEYQGMKLIEEWEAYSMNQIGPAIGMMFGQVMSGEPDPAACAEASRMLNMATARIETALEKGNYLMGDSIKAPDVICAPAVFLATLPAAADASGPIHAAFRKNLILGEGRERTRDWVHRVIRHDPVSRAWF